MATARQTTDHNNNNSGIMVGVQFDKGIVLAIDMATNLIYYLDENIFCCAGKTGFIRETLLDTASKLENMSQNLPNFKGATVNKVQELLSKKCENAEREEMLLAGQDASGMHLFTLKSFGAHTRVSYAALGPGADKAMEYLQKEWKNGMNVRQAEKLVRNAMVISNGNKIKLDLCFLSKK